MKQDEDESDEEEEKDEDPRASRIRKRDTKRITKAKTVGVSRKITPRGAQASKRVSQVGNGVSMKFTPKKSSNKTPKSADNKQHSPGRKSKKLDNLDLGKGFEQNEKTPDYFRN